jgi:hypothetical protein
LTAAPSSQAAVTGVRPKTSMNLFARKNVSTKINRFSANRLFQQSDSVGA